MADSPKFLENLWETPMLKRFNKFEPQQNVVEPIDESVMLTDKAKLSLYKKSQNSGISIDILEEVYRRGYTAWDELIDLGTPEQYAFDRVNSFVAEGYALELDADLAEACWKNYKQIGVKKKGGKTVPNCVPKEEYTGAEKVSKDPNDPMSRFVGTTQYTKVLKHDTPGYEGNSRIKTIKRVVKEVQEDWQDKKYKNPEGGLTKAGVEAYRREHPGSKLKTAVTTPPSKLKPGSKAANRRKSFCARMGGMKKRLTSAKTARDPDSRINKALRKWNCEETQVGATE